MSDEKRIADLGGYELWGQGNTALFFAGVGILIIFSSVIFFINDDFGTAFLTFLCSGIPFFIFYLFDKSYFEKCYQKGLEVELEKAEINKYKPIPLTSKYEERKESWIKSTSKEWGVSKSDVESYFYSLETEGKAWWLNRKGRLDSSLEVDIFKETKISYLVSKQDWNTLVELKAVKEIIKVINILLNNEAMFDEDKELVWRRWHWQPHPDAVGKENPNPGDERGTRIFSALGKIGDSRAINFLVQCLQNKDETVRLAATRGLGKTRNESAIEPLTKALEDEEKNVRKSAANALDELEWNPNE